MVKSPGLSKYVKQENETKRPLFYTPLGSRWASKCIDNTYIEAGAFDKVYTCKNHILWAVWSQGRDRTTKSRTYQGFQNERDFGVCF